MSYMRTAQRAIAGIEDLKIDDVVPGVTCTVTQLSACPPSGIVHIADIDGITAARVRAHGSLRITRTLPDSYVAISISFQQIERTLIWGIETKAGDVALIPRSGQLDTVQCGVSDSLLIVIPAAATAEIAMLRDLSAGGLGWLYPFALSAEPRSRSQWADEIAKLVCGQAADRAGIRSAPATEARWCFLSLLARSLSDPSLFAAASRCAPANTTKIIHRAETLLAQTDDPLQLAAFVDQLGVSRRTLFRAYHELLGMGPSAYLRLRRLCAVRLDLLNNAHRRSVTESALQHGFWQLGRFSHLYKEYFGELPSQTIARRNAAPRLTGRLPDDEVHCARSGRCP